MIDDVIPLILTVMPKSWLSFLLSYPLISLSIAATVMLAALPIVFLIYQQTLHFEGKARLENLNQSAENKITLNSSIGCLTGKNYLKLIKVSLNTMGPLHAPQAMAPLAIALQQIREQSEDYINPLTYWILGGLVTLLIGIIYGTGIHFSEVAEAKNDITKELNTLGIFGVEQENNHSDSNVTQEYNHQKPPV